jgi:hypothetical protein
MSGAELEPSAIQEVQSVIHTVEQEKIDTSQYKLTLKMPTSAQQVRHRARFTVNSKKKKKHGRNNKK